MPDRVAGYLIHFDEERRNHLLNGIRDPGDGFSDALSSADWSVRQWEVCGLMFEPDTITHWALARKGHRVATGKVKVDFTEVTPTGISIADVVQRVGETARRYSATSSAAGQGLVALSQAPHGKASNERCRRSTQLRFKLLSGLSGCGIRAVIGSPARGPKSLHRSVMRPALRSMCSIRPGGFARPPCRAGLPRPEKA